MSDYIKIILFITTCLFIIISITKLMNTRVKRDELKFLLSSLIITIFLAFIFEFKPHHILRAKFNITNLIIYLFYFAIVGIYFAAYVKLLLKYNYILIIISFVFFGLANAFDILFDGKLIDFDYNEELESLLHISGIIFWLLFFIDYLKLLKRNTNNH